MTFPDLVPYLKGIHLTLDSWRRDRKGDGWKLQSEEDWLQFLHDQNINKADHQNCKKYAENFRGQSFRDAPRIVYGVKRLQMDLIALSKLLGLDKPPKRLIRGNGINEVVY